MTATACFAVASALIRLSYLSGETRDGMLLAAAAGIVAALAVGIVMRRILIFAIAATMGAATCLWYFFCQIWHPTWSYFM
jgi:hypothetical protein